MELGDAELLNGKPESGSRLVTKRSLSKRNGSARGFTRFLDASSLPPPLECGVRLSCRRMHA